VTFSVRENIDFVLGGTFLATAPMFPQICSVITTGQINDALTILIQVLSVVLICARIIKTNERKNEDSQDT